MIPLLADQQIFPEYTDKYLEWADVNLVQSAVVVSVSSAIEFFLRYRDKIFESLLLDQLEFTNGTLAVDSESVYGVVKRAIGGQSRGKVDERLGGRRPQYLG
jgi:hypothetical protein